MSKERPALARFLGRVLEKMFGVYYEGPEAPKRISDIVLDFANHNPEATREEWVAFAQSHAAVSYRSGYARGVEWTDRDLGRREPPVPVEELLHHNEVHEWRWPVAPGDLTYPEDVPKDAEPKLTALAARPPLMFKDSPNRRIYRRVRWNPKS